MKSIGGLLRSSLVQLFNARGIVCEASVVHYNASKSIGSFGCESWYEHHAERSNLKAGQCNDPDPQQTPLTLRNALPRPRQIQISNHNLVVIRYWYCDLGDWHPSLGLGGWVGGGQEIRGKKVWTEAEPITDGSMNGSIKSGDIFELARQKDGFTFLFM